MARILILEDDHNRHTQFRHKFKGYDLTIVETAKECIDELKAKTHFDALFLDHDLGGQQMVESGDNTGYEVAKWLEENPEYQPNEIYLHSLNPYGRRNMKAALPKAFEAPLLWVN